MSWMDSWSRPGKSQAVPAPYYLLPNGGEETPYCRSCGRVISSRRTTTATTSNNNNNGDSAGPPAGGVGAGVKYCSARCRHSKPGKLDREIEDVFLKLLQGQSHEEVVAAVALTKGSAGSSGEAGGPSQSQDGDGQELAGIAENADKEEGKSSSSSSHHNHKRHKSKSVKGDNRILVLCDEVEEIVFGPKADPAKVYGRKKNRASRVIHAQEGDGSGERNSTVAERGPSYGTTKYQTDSGDSAIELDDEDFDEGEYSGDDESQLHAHLRRKSVSGNNNNNAANQGTGLDGHTAAALSVRSGTRVRPAQIDSEVNGSVGGEKGWAERSEESEEMTQRRIEGQQRAQRKETVRCAARRLVVFGPKTDQDQAAGNADDGGNDEGKPNMSKKKKKGGKNSSKSMARDDMEAAAGRGHQAGRKCEAVMQGKVVEPSYAKGNWGIRWRED